MRDLQIVDCVLQDKKGLIIYVIENLDEYVVKEVFTFQTL